MIGRNVHHSASSSSTSGDGREEFNRTYQLASGAEVEIRGINGSVEVQSSDSDVAEVHVVRTANNHDDLEMQRIIIEQTPTSLSVYSEKGGKHWWNFFASSGQVRQQVTLRLPRRVDLTTRGINGPVQIGEMDGAVHLSGINGRVEVAQATGYAEASGINGGVRVGISQLGAQGLRFSGINGNIELRMKENVNADLSVRGLNGIVSLDLPNVSEQEKTRSNVRARIGEGGAPISMSGINGRIQLTSAAPAATTN